jgi:coproporphyrinogen III oxidase-like Fe-S oxidoreductase
MSTAKMSSLHDIPVKGTELTRAETWIVESLRFKSMSTDRLLRRHGFEREDLNGHLRNLRRKGIVECDGKIVRLTDKGRDLVRADAKDLQQSS